MAVVRLLNSPAMEWADIGSRDERQRRCRDTDHLAAGRLLASTPCNLSDFLHNDGNNIPRGAPVKRMLLECPYLWGVRSCARREEKTDVVELLRSVGDLLPKLTIHHAGRDWPFEAN